MMMTEIAARMPCRIAGHCGPSRWRHPGIVGGGSILGLFIVYQVVVYFVAYTDDAYVRSDLVAVASEVTGPILKVHVVDNQDVKKGDRLFTIDPVPFQLIVNQRQAPRHK